MDPQASDASPAPREAEIDVLKARLAKAESDRDTWRAAGHQESYLEACSMVDALALQLERLEGAARHPAAPRVPIIPATKPPGSSPSAPRDEVAKLITFNGRQYSYRGYRYDRLAEATDYARLDRSRAFADPGADDAAPLEPTAAPNEAELDLMRTLGIRFADGVFHWREYRYDRLADAMAYASREQAREAGEGSRKLAFRRK